MFARFDALDARMNAMESHLDSRISTVESPMSALEEKVDHWLQETRSMWEAVQEQLERLNVKIDVVISDFYEMKTDLVRLGKRVTNLEDRRA